MKRFTTLEELLEAPLKRGILGALRRALGTEQELAVPEPYDPEKGSVWLLQSTDTDRDLIAVFGKPLTELAFEQVRYHPDDEHFLCHLVRNNSRCDTLVVPDLYWLDDGIRAWLLSQL